MALSPSLAFLKKKRTRFGGRQTTINMYLNKGSIGILKGKQYCFNCVIVPPENHQRSENQEECPRQLTFDNYRQLENAHTQVINRLESGKRKHCVHVVYSLGLLLSLTQSVLFGVYISMYKPTPTYRCPPYEQSNVETVEGAESEDGPRILERSFWVAQPPICPMDPNILPVAKVIVHHTTTEECYKTSECVLSLRYLQSYYVNSKYWCDIAYNFVIGGDGNVYEGRGWNFMGAHVKNHNNNSIGVAFLGTFTTKLPTPSQIDAFNRLIKVGVSIQKISPNYSLLAQCQLNTMDSTWALANNMRDWPHFDTRLPILCEQPKNMYKEEL